MLTSPRRAKSRTSSISQFGKPISTVIDSRQINVNIGSSGTSSVPDLISQIQNLSISVHPPAKVVVNERTGTIVMGGDVKLSAVSVLHGRLERGSDHQLFGVATRTVFQRWADRGRA